MRLPPRQAYVPWPCRPALISRLRRIEPMFTESGVGPLQDRELRRHRAESICLTRYRSLFWRTGPPLRASGQEPKSPQSRSKRACRRPARSKTPCYPGKRRASFHRRADQPQMSWPRRDFEKVEQRCRHEEKRPAFRLFRQQWKKRVQTINAPWQQVTLGGLEMAVVIKEKSCDCRAQMGGDRIRQFAALPFPLP